MRRRFTELAADIGAQTGDDRSPEQVAEGYLRIAVANMANAVKRISVEKGHDVTEYVLITFGGAGGQHACAMADALGSASCWSRRWRACSPHWASAWPTPPRCASSRW